MRRLICLLIVTILLLCGCSQKQQLGQSNGQAGHLTIGNFSYEDDCAYHKEEILAGIGVKQSGFVNTEKTEINDAAQAIELANKECTVDYDTISVAFDASSMMYKVCFYKIDWLGGDQTVYINQEGITQLIIYGE